MKVVIDTNIFLVSIPAKSKYRPIFDAFLESKISMVITTSIYNEYIEIVQKQAKQGVAEYTSETLLSARNVIIPEVYYNWNLIAVDPDDNKFTDAYIAANAEYLVTNDSHFNEVKKAGFPPVNIITADEFLEVLNKLNR